jgi:hypothetical protein
MGSTLGDAIERRGPTGTPVGPLLFALFYHDEFELVGFPLLERGDREVNVS